jgi:probable HAF family extracellular repeat protein
VNVMCNNSKQIGRWIAIAAVIGLVCFSQTLADKPPKPDDPTVSYTAVDLGALSGGDYLQSRAQSISQVDNTGTVLVAGNSYAAGQWHPVLWAVGADGSFDPSVYPLDLDPINQHANVVSVNTAGVVVEWLGYVFQPFEPDLETQDLSTVEFEAYTTAVNNLDEITGWVVYDNGTDRWGFGAIWMLDEDGVPGVPTLLPGFIPQDISDTGLMAGNVAEMGTAAVASFEGGELQVTSLGVLPGYDVSEANAISSDGVWVAGSCTQKGPPGEYGGYILIAREAFVWSESTGMIGLGRLGGISSEAMGVNSVGQVVGYSDTKRGRDAAFLWLDGKLLDLNAVSDAGKNHLTWALDINDAGQIVGELRLPRPVSEEHAFVLIPNGE